MITKRYEGADIPPDMGVALENNGTVVGYAKDNAAADQYIAQAGNDTMSQDFFRKKFGDRMVSASAEDVTRAVGERMAVETPQETRQHLRRMEQFRRVFDTFLLERVGVSHGPNILSVSWEEFEKMHKEYRDAQAVNEHRDFPFQPLASYAAKLKRPDGREIRPIFVNECGVWTDRNGTARICILKDQAPGDKGERYFQVPGSTKED